VESEAIAMTTTTYPVHVDAHLDPHVGRALWLVKWLLAIPHYIILVFLWVAFVVTSVVALGAILVTGRYPRVLFDFNVGVLRWTWRVGYYAYGALGTDQYPPFTLRERPDYPAHLEVDYPEHLSRGLVLIKWWLLALPHYLVVGILLSGGLTLAGDLDGGEQWVTSTGLLGLLVFVAAVVLLFTGQYPRPLFDLVLGLNRWILRVAAYAGLMTDRYPPFRLDQGGHEEGAGCLMVPPSGDTTALASATRPSPSPNTQMTPTGDSPVAPAPPAPTPSRPPRTGWTAGRVTALVTASLLLLASLGLVVGGVLAAWADDALRDDAGYVMSGSELLTTPTYAVTSEPLEMHLDEAAGFVPDTVIGRARLTATSQDGAELFLGVAPTSDVDQYLSGVANDRVTDLGLGPAAYGRTAYVTTGGGPPTTLPSKVDIWRAASTGVGEVTITWPLEEGDWTLVVMNADGARDIAADVSAGATLPMLDLVAPVLLSIGGTGLVVAGIALALTIRSAERSASQAGG
jgi:hypothetical protein